MIRRAARKLRLIARYYTLCAKGKQWLFVLGHMRSGSSLLVHLLNSHEEILGYGETHLDYHGRHSLVDLHDHVREEFEKHGEVPTESPRYIMDKLLWPHIRDDNLLRRTPLKIIVIVRAPDNALPSILSLDFEGIQTSREALKYYSRSLERTKQNLAVYDAPFVLVRYKDLTKQTEQTLQKLSRYLELRKPLNPEYDTMWSTGKSGIGDASERIGAGKVISRQTGYEVDIKKDILSRARERYKQFLSACNPRANFVHPVVQR